MENIISKIIKFIVVYARVSTSNQEIQETIEAQLLQVREFAKKNGYIIIKEYIDNGWSGENLARPNLDQLRNDAKDKKWDAVLIYDPDRLGRDLFLQMIVIDELKQIGMEILFVTMPPVKNASDELLFGVRGLFAQYEKAKITERFRIGKVNRARNNHVLTSEAPYGYTYVLNKGKRGSADYVVGHFEINEYEAEIVKKMFNWIDKENLTLRAVVKRLEDLGIKPRRSKRGVWNTSTLSTLYRNETYAGTAYWGASYATVAIFPRNKEKYRKVKKTSKRMKARDEWIPIKVPALVDRDLFDRVGMKLKRNFEMLGRNKKNKYLLAGKIWCTCGRRRCGEGPQRGKHLYYRCTDRVYSFPLPRTCLEHGINARIVDEVIWQKIKAIMSSPKLLSEQIERLKESTKNISGLESTINIESTLFEIKKLQTQEDRLAKAYSEGVIPLEKFEEYVAPIREKIRDFENQIGKANLEKTPKNEILIPSSSEIEAFAKECREYLENPSFEMKKDIILSAISKTTASRESLQTYGMLNLSDIYVKFFTEYRNSGVAECGEIDAF